MINGFFKRLLSIDLSNREWKVDPIDEDLLRKYLGGKGLATHLLLERNPKDVDPFAPENHIIFGLGPISDSPIYGSCRHGIFSKSPLTGFYAESYAGGSAAIGMSRTGFDAIILKGISESPLWLEITDTDVMFHSADALWGLDTFATESAVAKKLEPKNAAILVIGPAGENRVRFAVVKNDGWRVSGRTGMGAILGSKKIKALAFHGNQRRSWSEPDTMKDFAKGILNQWRNEPITEAYRSMGTPMMVDLVNNAGGFPARYWYQGKIKHREKINAQSIKNKCNPRPNACRTCFLACGNRIEIQEGRHKGLKLEGPEYETIYAFGGLCLIDQIEEIAYLNDVCDRMGIDTISSGNLCAFAIEAAHRGKIKEQVEYGQPSQIAALLLKIVRREGVGGLLAEGIRLSSEELGLEKIAVHTKGLEPPGYDPRALKGMGLAYAVSDRGACHLRSTFYKAELAGMIDPDQIEGKAELFIDFEDRCTLFDTLILCRFYRDLYPWDHLSKLIAMSTGITLSKKELQNLASQITNNTRRFNLREGLKPKDDRLPLRLLKETLPNGNGITKQNINNLVDDYYKRRGWSKEGFLTINSDI